MDGGARFTRLSKTIAALIFALCLVTNFVPSSRAYLTLVPGRTLPCIWNLVTAGFVTTHPAKALAEILAVLLLARLVEPIYGSTEFLRFVVLVDAAPALLTFAATYLVYITAPEKEGRLLYTQYNGFHGVVAGLLVAVKQIMPDLEVKLLGLVTFRARYFASLYVLAAGTASALLLPTLLPFLLCGFYTSWIYLRYFQRQPETDLRGDPSEDFKFSTFFPDALAPPLDAVGGVGARLLGLNRSAGGAVAGDGKALASAGSGGSLGSDAVDSSRRRERGAKALEERLAAVTKRPDVAPDAELGFGSEAIGGPGNGTPLPQSSSAVL